MLQGSDWSQGFYFIYSSIFTNSLLWLLMVWNLSCFPGPLQDLHPVPLSSWIVVLRYGDGSLWISASVYLCVDSKETLCRRFFLSNVGFFLITLILLSRWPEFTVSEKKKFYSSGAELLFTIADYLASANEILQFLSTKYYTNVPSRVFSFCWNFTTHVKVAMFN